jgi:transcriptional regulator with XRE-family HTH domain
MIFHKERELEMAIKDRIRQLRQEKNWSQTQLAQKMGIHQKQVSAYERGRNTPSTEVLIKLADIFDVSLDYLAFEAEDMPAKVDIKDRELLRKFEEIDKLSDKDKGTIKDILDTFILKNKFQNLAVPKEL